MAKSKWAWLKDEGYKNVNEETTYDEVLLQAIEQRRGNDLEALAKELNELEAEKERLEQETRGINLRITACERVMESAFESKGVDSIVVGGYRYTPKIEPAPKVSNAAEWLEYAFEHYRDNLSIHAQTLKGIVGRALEAGEDMPPGIEVNVRTSISRKKS